MIETLSALKTNAAFSKLAKLQSKLDTADTVMNNTSFTRSPFHVLSFLVSYAGLNTTDREYVIAHLPKDKELSLSKEELDTLIKGINWSAIIIKPSESALNFKLSITVKKTDLFYESIKKNAPQLFDALKNNGCIVKIEEDDCLIFTTQVEQKISWTQALDRESGSNYWSARQFSLSKALQKEIDKMSPGQSWDSWTRGGIHIKKGSTEKQELYIAAPKNSINEYSNKVKDLNVDPGIYHAFEGLGNFYGIFAINKVEVKLSNTATFSDDGATASQTQDVEYLCTHEGPGDKKDTPTVITIDSPLNVYYQGIDILARLGEGEKNYFAPDLTTPGAQRIDYFVSLPVKEEGTGIRLYPTQLTPSEVHELNFSSKNCALPLPSLSTNKNLTQDSRASNNYSFLFKMGMALSALTTLASIVVVALALSLVITLPPVAIGAVAAVGVTAAIIGLVGFFNKGREKPINEELRQESSLVASS